MRAQRAQSAAITKSDWMFSMTPRFIARQLSRPTGLAGAIIGYLMNRGNAKINHFALEHLEVKTTDRVLEIGFGGGVILSPLVENAGFVVGLDRSPDVIRRAGRKFARARAGRRAAFHEGHVETLPFGASSFEKIITVNTVYFWKSLDQGFRECHRVLASTGLLVVGFLPKDRMDRMGMPADIFTSRTREQMVAAIESAGFANVRVEKPQANTAWMILVAARL
jgi:ubiquinone/menaquinone biosynthesis C-methylase UbiE